MSDLRVSVRPRDQFDFWYAAPLAAWRWIVRSPSCVPGDRIIWRMNRQVVAQARILQVEPRRPGSKWHLICWDGRTFEDLREDLGPDFKPQLYGGYVWNDGNSPA